MKISNERLQLMNYRKRLVEDLDVLRMKTGLPLISVREVAEVSLPMAERVLRLREMEATTV